MSGIAIALDSWVRQHLASPLSKLQGICRHLQRVAFSWWLSKWRLTLCWQLPPQVQPLALKHSRWSGPGLRWPGDWRPLSTARSRGLRALLTRLPLPLHWTPVLEQPAVWQLQAVLQARIAV